jgi:hypothetical protein
LECDIYDKPPVPEALRYHPGNEEQFPLLAERIYIDLSSSPLQAIFAACILHLAHAEASLSREAPAWFWLAVTVMNFMSRELFRRMKRAISRLRRGKLDRSKHQELMITIVTLLFTVPIMEPLGASSDLWTRKKNHLELVLCHYLRGFPLIHVKDLGHESLPSRQYKFHGLALGILMTGSR